MLMTFNDVIIVINQFDYFKQSLFYFPRNVAAGRLRIC